ncbi:MAG: hypothetical protein V4485_05135 [Pseudomonadota bacterium]
MDLDKMNNSRIRLVNYTMLRKKKDNGVRHGKTALKNLLASTAIVTASLCSETSLANTITVSADSSFVSLGFSNNDSIQFTTGGVKLIADISANTNVNTIDFGSFASTLSLQGGSNVLTFTGAITNSSNATLDVQSPMNFTLGGGKAFGGSGKAVTLKSITGNQFFTADSTGENGTDLGGGCGENSSDGGSGGSLTVTNGITLSKATVTFISGNTTDHAGAGFGGGSSFLSNGGAGGTLAAGTISLTATGGGVTFISGNATSRGGAGFGGGRGVNGNGGSGGVLYVNNLNISSLSVADLSNGSGGKSTGGFGFGGGAGAGAGTGGSGGLLYIANFKLGEGSSINHFINIYGENGGADGAVKGGGGGSIEIGTLTLAGANSVAMNTKQGKDGNLGDNYNKASGAGGAGSTAGGAAQGGHAYIGNLTFDISDSTKTVTFGYSFNLMGYQYKKNSDGSIVMKPITAPNGSTINVPDTTNYFTGSGGVINVKRSINAGGANTTAASPTLILGYEDSTATYPAGLTTDNAWTLTFSGPLKVETYFNPNSLSATPVNTYANANAIAGDTRGDRVIIGGTVNTTNGSVTGGTDGAVVGGGSVRVKNYTTLSLAGITSMDVTVHGSTPMPQQGTVYRYYSKLV